MSAHLNDELNLAITRAIVEAAQGGQPVAVATVIKAPVGSPVAVGEKMLVHLGGNTIGHLQGLHDTIVECCLDALARHALETVRVLPDGQVLPRGAPRSQEAIEVFIETVEAPAVLIIVGGGHIGQALAQIGALCGFSVAVVDDRPDYASRERFPEADNVICGDFTKVLSEYPITTNTFIVIVTRGHKQDEISLRAVARSPARYIGMIGSRRRVTAVLQHLLAEGVPRAAIERVHTPIGLDIGAETPAEIAVSIIAEIIKERRGGSALPMSQTVDVKRHL